MKALLPIFLLFIISCSPKQDPVLAISGQTMGTTYTVKVIQPADMTIDLGILKAEIDDALIQVNALMSTYDPKSELSLLNSTKAGIPFPISRQTEYVLTEAMRLNELSQGSLDVTVGPLVNLWGFGPDQRPEKIPTPSQLANVAELVGLDRFHLRGGQVTKANSKVYIDLSTIAKGYAVDVVADILEQNQIQNYLVEIGGEMRVSGVKPNGVDWKIAIEKPIVGQRAVQQLISIGDNAIATSGDYRNYFEKDGIRYSHLIEPTTGYPISHNLVSVTVIHPSSMTADGLATALNVMGTKKAKDLVLRNNIAVFMVLKVEDKFVEYASPAFEEKVTRY
ncbi:MAG: thiamine biosynthesis lipoprotein [Glaciecola sp.]